MNLIMGVTILTSVALYLLYDNLPTYCLKFLKVERSFPVENCYVGDTQQMKMKLFNGSFLPLTWLMVEGDLPGDVSLNGQKNGEDTRMAYKAITMLKPKTAMEYSYDCTFHKRGYYLFYNLDYQLMDYMGFRKYTGILPDRLFMYVYPSIQPVEALVDFSRLYMGTKEVRRWVVEDPLLTVGSRDYMSSDPMKYIHWNATARTGTLQVRKFSHSTEMSTMVILNAQTKTAYWDGQDDQILETMVSTVAAFISDFEKKQHLYGLSSNCPIQEGAGGVMIPFGQGRKHFHHVFKALALINHYTFCSADRIFKFVTDNSPKTARLLLVTCILTDEMRKALALANKKGFTIEVVSPSGLVEQWQDQMPYLKWYAFKEVSHEGA